MSRFVKIVLKQNSGLQNKENKKEIKITTAVA